MLGQYILIASTLASAVVGFLVVYNNLNSVIHRLYALLTASFIILSLANYFSLVPSPEQPFYVRTVMTATTVGIYLLYILVTVLKNPTKPLRRIAYVFAVFTAIVAIIDYTPFLFSEVIAASPAQPVAAPGFLLYALHFVGLAVVSLVILIRGAMFSTGKHAMQYKLVLLGIIPIVFFAPLTGFIFPLMFQNSSLIVLTPVYTLFFVICVGYAMIKHGLFDIKLAAVRSAAYVFSLLSLGLIYYAMAYVVSVTLFSGQTASSVSVNPANIALALVLAFIFQPIKHFFDRLTDSIFYKDRYQIDDFFARFSELLASTTDLRGLLERASQEITDTFKTEHTFFWLYYSNGVKHHMSAGTPQHNRLPPSDVDLLDDMFTANKSGTIVLTDMLPDASAVRRMLISHKITLVMSLKHAGNTIGYVFLGELKSGPYTKRDLKVLTTVSDELIIAIQNALSVHEIKEINATLQQRIDVATKELRSSNAQLRHIDEVKDEFISMASHQLRTPLTSIKGYLSMVLEGDMGKVTPQQETVLKEAFNSSERMVRLISDFLNVSRLQTGKFLVEYHPTDLGSVVEQETNSLRLIAEAHNIKLSVKVPKKSLPTIELDEAKVRQVIMNFIDNAIYYSRPETTITVSLEQIDDELAFVVADTGIGVPVEEQAKLFHKFFRATNARKQRPDGTGVGLFLAKKVITAHGGKMIFSSTEGKGSKFGFRIPVDTSKKRTQINEA